MAVYRVQVGSEHGLEPRNLVGAISNETGIPAKAIGTIRIAKDSSLVELPAGMPKDLLHAMKNIWVCGVKLNIAHEGDGPIQPRGIVEIRRLERAQARNRVPVAAPEMNDGLRSTVTHPERTKPNPEHASSCERFFPPENMRHS